MPRQGDLELWASLGYNKNPSQTKKLSSKSYYRLKEETLHTLHHNQLVMTVLFCFFVFPMK